jgi:2-polyprenyl-3-methyl-5-hydroxy-6-metoxy-1,4-benzoquinol methylase
MEKLMLNLIKRQIHGIVFLLSNPYQLKHLILRETRYKFRNKNKRLWIEWQKYDSKRAYDALMEALHDTRTRPFNQERIKIIAKMIAQVGNKLEILDVGSGDGIIGENLYKMGHTVISVDLPTVVVQAHRIQGLLSVAGDAERLSFASHSFDVVLASEIMEHLWNPHGLIEETYRLLKENGYFIISTPEGIDGLRYDAHKFYFTLDILKRMLNKKFELCEFERLKPELSATPTIILSFRRLTEEKL